MPEILDLENPLQTRADLVFAIANARLRGELTDTEWQIILDEVNRCSLLTKSEK